MRLALVWAAAVFNVYGRSVYELKLALRAAANLLFCLWAHILDLL